MTTRDTVHSTMQDVAREQQKTLPMLSDDLVLLDSGLDSLGFAILVARLEGELGVDPFASADDVDFPVTVGDLVRAYDRALAQHAA